MPAREKSLGRVSGQNPVSGPPPASLSSGNVNNGGWQSVFTDYLIISNDWLHGFHFSHPRYPKLFSFMSVVIQILSLAFSVYLCLLATWDYQEHLMTSDIVDSVYSKELVLFPAVTLCSSNRGQRSFFKRLGFSMNPKDWLSHRNQSSRLEVIKNMIYNGRSEDFTPAELDYIEELLAQEDIMDIGHDLEAMRMEGPDFMKKLNLTKEGEHEHEHNHRRRSIFMMGSQQEHGFPSLLQFKFNDDPLEDRPDLRHALYGTSQGFCTHIRPHVFWNPNFRNLSFDEMIRSHEEVNTSNIGDTSGLTILIDAEVWDYAHSMEKAAGFKLYIHHFRDHPALHLGKLLLRPGQKYHVGLSPELIFTTPSAIRRFYPEERKCYTEDEFDFNWLPDEEFRYSSTNCLNVALFDKVYEECGCSTGPDGYGCFGTEITCRDRILDQVGFLKFAQNKKRGNHSQICLPSCHDETFEARLDGQFAFPEYNSFLFEPEFMCLMLNRIEKICEHKFKRSALSEIYPDLCEDLQNSTLDFCEEFPNQNWDRIATMNRMSMVQDNLSRSLFLYARENLIQVKIYFNTLHVKKLIRSEKQPMIWFVANLAGLIGLVVGSSLLMACQAFSYSLLWCGVELKDLNCRQRPSPRASPSPSPPHEP
ncbi:hypothetical protein TCAL_09326 [Tigriopus californicus]|uniref:Uncharacterized protein n=1 Tax=Tigriopus californicus TaxID=6832 RepID=A0A553PQW5_TIGCA|nr:uncharacterized protein LOC131882802 [Tigriopus californicus]XP_059086050.1 uncharacterized protein LOC131882802 [Tigriopus californicus]TRY80077.1 hypothetical protein TCAL_09326 [Tigriopus californicus]